MVLDFDRQTKWVDLLFKKGRNFVKHQTHFFPTCAIFMRLRVDTHLRIQVKNMHIVSFRVTKKHLSNYFKGTRGPRLLLLSQPLDVVHQVVPVNVHPGLLVGQLIHLTPQVPHLILVQISDPGGAFAPQLLQLRQQDLVLLLQESHLLDVAGESVVERLHLCLLVGAVRDELGVYGVGQGKVQVLGG